MDLNYISPYIRFAHDCISEEPWQLKERVIFDYELLYVKEGSIYITIEEKGYVGNPGDIFLFKPKQRHSIVLNNSPSFRQPHLHFDLFYKPDSPDVKVSFKPLEQLSEDEKKWFREDATSGELLRLPNKLSVRNIKYFEQILFEIIEEFKTKMPFYEVHIKGLFIKLWTYIIREDYINKNPVVLSNIKELTRIKDYLTVNLKREVTLDELSAEFNMSKYHMNRLYKKAFGIPPIHFHKMIRMEKIKEVIQFTDIDFNSIAEEYGFSSVNAFSRAFSKTDGVPPSFYRRKK